jgi:TonB family protein
MLIVLRAAGVGLLLMLTSVAASAQAGSELAPPVALSNTDVPYPEGAAGDAAVVLELVVEKDGSVSSATVVEGREPFAEAARTAALAFRFTPAQRDNQPVAARVRARVVFQPEPEEPAAAPAGSAPHAPASALAPAAPPPPPVEITVSGVRREIGQTTLSKTDVREMPGAFGDAFRAIEALPGVTPLASGLPYFYVRGAPPNNAGYFVDGVRVPLLFHLGLAQGVIHPGLIDHVDFFPSAAPARYGGFAGAIIAGQTREPATEFHGEAHLRLVDAGALLEAPFAEGRGSALVAGRYGFPGPVLSAVTSDLKLNYWDYQARASWQLGQNDGISVLAFGSHDYLATRSDNSLGSQEFNEEFVSDFHRVDLRYDHTLSDGRVRLALTAGYDSQGAAPTYITDRSLGARLEIEQQLAQALRFRGGVEARLDAYGTEITGQGPLEAAIPNSADPPPTNLGAGLHADFVWRPSDRVELVPGMRFDLYTSSRRNLPPSSQRTSTVIPAADPRLSTRVTLTAGVAWLSTFGLAHQYPSLRVGKIPAAVLSVPGFPFENQQLQSAAQASQGFELALPVDLTLTVTGFYSNFWGLTDVSSSCYQWDPGFTPEPEPGPRAPPPFVCPNNEPVRGRGYGVELLLRRPLTKRLSGLLSYTLSRTTREAHFLTPEGVDEVATVPSEFDRTHVFNAILGYDLGRRWRAGTRLLFYTGTPYSKLDGSIPVPPYHAYRRAAFYRVDVRLEKRWRLGQDGSIAFVLEGQNVTLSKEISSLGRDCESMGTPEAGTTECVDSTIGPLTIPSVGVEAFF